LIDDRKKLVSEGTEIVPSGSSTLRTAGPAAMFVEIYEPLLKTNPQIVVAFQLRVLDRANNAVKADTGLMRLDLAGKQGPTIPLGLNLPVKDLAAGPYILEFEALDSDGKSAKRTTPFEIE
jgi:hypothetical protein